MSDNLDVAEWIRYAQTDYDVANKIAKEFRPLPIEIVCFHCQQSAEKILKAYAIANSEPLIKTHDLSVILAQCKKHDNSFADFDRMCFALSDYAVANKYPSNEDAVTEHDMLTALKNAFEILEFTKMRLEEM